MFRNTLVSLTDALHHGRRRGAMPRLNEESLLGYEPEIPFTAGRATSHPAAASSAAFSSFPQPPPAPSSLPLLPTASSSIRAVSLPLYRPPALARPSSTHHLAIDRGCRSLCQSRSVKRIGSGSNRRDSKAQSYSVSTENPFSAFTVSVMPWLIGSLRRSASSPTVSIASMIFE